MMRGESTPNTCLAVKQFAEDAGVKPKSIRSWGKQQHAKGKRCLKDSVYIRLYAAEQYMNPHGVPRAAHRPKSWLTVKGVAEELKMSKNKVYRLIHNKELEARWHKGVFYINPEDAAWLSVKQKDKAPLRGWELISEVRAQAGRSKQALDEWLETHHIDIRRYLHPRKNRLARYMPSDVAKAYKELADATSKYTPKRNAQPEEQTTPPLSITPHHQEAVILLPKEAQRLAEQNPHPHHDDSSPTGLRHLHCLRHEPSTTLNHHAGGRAAAPAQLGPH